MDEFLSAPLDVNSLRAAIRSIPGVPSHFNLSFVGPAPIDEEEVETRRIRWNEANVSRGSCIRFMDPDGPATPDPEPPGDAESPQQSDREFMDPQDTPVLDVDYDDSWVTNVPDVIGGYRVIRITTPKSLACSNHPRITLLAQQGSMDEFLSAPLDLPSLRTAIQSIPGVPSDVGLGFTGSPIDKEEMAEKNRRWNEANIREGCIHHSRLILEEVASPGTTSE